MRIGLLTGGGDCPGLDAAIRAVVRVGEDTGDQIIGFLHGWRGVVEDEAWPITTGETRGILQQGGTILGTARYHPDEYEGGVDGVLATIERAGIDVLVVIGGDGTLGFDTAVSTATEAVDRLHTTAESHDRLMVVEVPAPDDRLAGRQRRNRRRRGCDLRARGTHRSRGPGQGHPAPARPGILVLGGGRGRRCRTARASRARIAAFGRRDGRGRARGEHRLRDAPHGPRTRPAGRAADRNRPVARHHLRSGRRPYRSGPLLDTMVASVEGRIEVVSPAAVAAGPQPVPTHLLDVARKLTVR